MLHLRSDAKFRPQGDDGDAAWADPRTMTSEATQAVFAYEHGIVVAGEAGWTAAISASGRAPWLV
jgi:hypothetical protein